MFYAIGLQSMRHLRLWKPEGKPVGTAVVRFLVVVCILMAGLRLFAEPLNFKIKRMAGVGMVDVVGGTGAIWRAAR